MISVPLDRCPRALNLIRDFEGTAKKRQDVPAWGSPLESMTTSGLLICSNVSVYVSALMPCPAAPCLASLRMHPRPCPSPSHVKACETIPLLLHSTPCIITSCSQKLPCLKQSRKCLSCCNEYIAARAAADLPWPGFAYCYQAHMPDCTSLLWQHREHKQHIVEIEYILSYDVTAMPQ